jgi:protoporphyrinogen oxidase
VNAPDHDFVVLGCGPAGLGAAYRLAVAGRKVCVLERDAAVGGLAASFEVAGLRVDHGSHRLHPSTPAPILAVLHELLGSDLQRRRRNGRIRMADRFVAFPPQPLDLVRRLPLGVSARLARDLATSAWRTASTDTFDAVVRASLGTTMADRFYAPYVEKLFGVPATQLAGELARRRVGASSASALVRRVVHPDADRAVFFSPRRGYGQIPEVLADAASRAGAVIETGTEVTAVKAFEDRVEVETADGTTLRTAAVWSTLPLPVLARIAGAPSDVLTAAARLETRAMVLVYLALPIARWTPFDAHYFPERDVLLSRCSEPKNYRDSADDPAHVTVVCAEVPCAITDARWTEPPDVLAVVVRDALARSELPTPTPIDVVVKRVPSVYPVYRVGFESAFAPLDMWAASLSRILTFGRHGLFAHDNTHHALAMAWAAADAIGADGLVDTAAWAAARERFASHVVED